MTSSRTPAPWLVLAVTTIAAFANSFATSSVNVALPLISAEFAMDGVALNWIITAFVLSATALVMPMGRLGDIFGRQRIFLVGMFVYAIGALASALAPNGAWLIASRFFGGIGGAMIVATATAFLVAAYPPSQRGRVLGIYTASVYLGLSMGPPLGGLFVQAFGWRMLIGLHLLLAVSAILLTLFNLRANDKAEVRGRFDLGGSVLFSAGLTLLLVGVSDLPGLAGILLCSAGTLVLGAFWLVEARAANPILPVSLITGNRVFAFANLATLLSYSATFAVSFFLSLYLSLVRGLSPAQSGLVLLTQPTLMALLSPLTGRLSDRVSPGLLASLGMGLTTIGLAGLALMGADTPLPLVVLGLVVLGCGFGIFSSPNTNSVMGSVDKSQLGMASATVATMRGAGQVLSMALSLVLLSVILGGAEVGPGTAPGLLMAQHWAFGIAALLCALGIPLSLMRTVPAPQAVQDESPSQPEPVDG